MIAVRISPKLVQGRIGATARRQRCVCANAHTTSYQGMDSRTFTIKRGGQTVGVEDEEARHYVIGFQNASIARAVQYSMSPEGKPRLEHGARVDVAGDVNVGLTKIGVDEEMQVASLVIDAQAVLHIPKFLGQGGSDAADEALRDGGFHLATVASEDFLNFPFTHSLGIVIPVKLAEETPERFTFNAMVVEACFHPRMARGMLNSIQ